MNSDAHRNKERVAQVAGQLEELADEFVFVGGAVVGFLLTDPAAPDVRPTLDVDVIVEVASLTRFYELQERLRSKGFAEDTEDGVICRWKKGDHKLDVMPTDESILGFSNRWYRHAIHHADQVTVEGVKIRVVSAPCFIATKLEAFQSRGEGDAWQSADLEDVIAVIDGRSEIVEEVATREGELREYLTEQFS